jgi:hypothetical protein
MYVLKYGCGMNSEHPTKRNLYIEVRPVEVAITRELLRVVAGELKNLVHAWDFDVSGKPWYKYRACNHCIARQVYEQTKFESGEPFWNRKYCWRHYLIEHLDDLIGLDPYDLMENNRRVEFDIDKQVILFKLASNNYNYSVTINRTQALLECVYKNNRKFVFKYSNHAKSFSFMSSYLVILQCVLTAIHNTALYLEAVANGRLRQWYNLYVNGILIFEAEEE